MVTFVRSPAVRRNLRTGSSRNDKQSCAVVLIELEVDHSADVLSEGGDRAAGPARDLVRAVDLFDGRRRPDGTHRMIGRWTRGTPRSRGAGSDGTIADSGISNKPSGESTPSPPHTEPTDEPNDKMTSNQYSAHRAERLSVFVVWTSVHTRCSAVWTEVHTTSCG